MAVSQRTCTGASRSAFAFWAWIAVAWVAVPWIVASAQEVSEESESANARSGTAEGIVSASPSADETAKVLVVVGAPGTEEYGKGFTAWSNAWKSAAEKGGAKVALLGSVNPDGEAATGSPGESDRERLRALLTAAKVVSSKPLWVVLIGHGTFDGRVAKFNLVGVDVSATEINTWLAESQRPVVVVNCASSSGPFINRLATPGRIVVTATKSGYEYNYARFGAHLAAAMVEQKTDIDKDGQVSLLEAFLEASARTAEFYAGESRLATEHALLDDNGDGRGTPASWFRGIRAIRSAADGAPLDGRRANEVVLIPGKSERAMSGEQRQRRETLEAAIESLRPQREALGDELYFRRLESAVLELSRFYAELEDEERKTR